MKRFRYQGPVASVTLPGGLDVNFHPGAEVDLPEDNDYIRTLVAKGFLLPLPAPKVAQKADKADSAQQEKP
ncbi:MAG TPA: hypothetical protein VNN55_08975 [bacterium]|nr:hypothetical protein [bacterium]